MMFWSEDHRKPWRLRQKNVAQVAKRNRQGKRNGRPKTGAKNSPSTRRFSIPTLPILPFLNKKEPIGGRVPNWSAGLQESG